VLLKDKNVITNFIYLCILQISNYVIPFLIDPYLIRTLTIENYGKISFGLVFIMYLVMIIEYGFNLSATREISIYQNNNKKISEIFFSVISAKFILMIFTILILFLILYVFKLAKFSQEKKMFIYYTPMLLGYTFFPVWLFQGMEKMKYITYYNIGIKLFSCLCIFLIVKRDVQYEIVALIRGLSFLIMGLLSFFISIKKFRIKFSFYSISFYKVIKRLNQGKYIFFSTVVVSFYRMVPAIYVGIKFSYVEAGYYILADKLIRTGCNLLEPIKQAIYPYFSKNLMNNRDNVIEEAKYIIKIFALLIAIGSIIIWFLIPTIIKIFTGNINLETQKLLRIFLFIPLFTSIAGVLGTQLMLNLNLQKEFFFILVFSGILSIILLIAFSFLFSINGVAITVTFIEFLVMVLMYVVLKKKEFL
jgi:PST family polysaccharide transporter